MKKYNCSYCKKDFTSKRYKKYCSKECYKLGIRTENSCINTCIVCKKSFSVLKCYSYRKYCSKSCSTKNRWNNELLKNDKVQTKESNIKRSETLKGRKPWNKGLTKEIDSRINSKPKTDEKRLNISKGMIKKWKDPVYAESQLTLIRNNHNFGNKNRGKFGFREDIRIFVRSRWEANYIRYLNYVGITWEYEPKRFRLSNGKIYIPDFHLLKNRNGRVLDVWIEVFGYDNKEKRKKIAMCILEYNFLPLMIVEEKTYKEIEKEYSSKIIGWEK